ncbi:STM4014 family protein [Paenibacillus sp. 1P03SA]|uniref:STM4014 family protein n=1 Tax=Paenibacillus sp. 1P03SA TaxID=3132294 RepID=UPI0039A3730E
MPQRMILIGNPDNRRTAGLQNARAKLGLPPAVVLPYAGLLDGSASLAQAASLAGAASQPAGARAPLLRLDAPGELFAVERGLIALGAPDHEEAAYGDRLLPFGHRSDPQPLSVRSAHALAEQEGRQYHPSQWFRGFARLLDRLRRGAEELWPQPRWTNAPEDIAGMFDKRQTHRILSAAGVPVPRLLAPPEEIADSEALRGLMLSRRVHRVFVKLASGSGACGVVAYRINPLTGAEQAVTTVGVENYGARAPVFYNAMKPRRYTDKSVISQVLNWLLRHGAHVEQWIAKASYGGGSYDIRQLVVAGEACHSIARVSRTPITNLHLRSERVSVEELGLAPGVRERAAACAEKALAAFPRSAAAGIDVLLDSASHAPYILDINPFGDLLYRVVHKGMDPYEWQMSRLYGGSAETAAAAGDAAAAKGSAASGAAEAAGSAGFSRAGSSGKPEAAAASPDGGGTLL